MIASVVVAAVLEAAAVGTIDAEGSGNWPLGAATTWARMSPVGTRG